MHMSQILYTLLQMGQMYTRTDYGSLYLVFMYTGPFNTTVFNRTGGKKNKKKNTHVNESVKSTKRGKNIEKQRCALA